MRPTILSWVAALNVVVVGSWPVAQALAAEASKDITRVAIAVSGGPVAYTDQLKADVPAIAIEFRSRNIKAELEPVVIVNSGIVKEIRSEYYQTGRRALKNLSLILVQPAAYTIAQQANQIVVDIETPASVLPGRMAVGKGVTVLGIEARETLVQRLKVMEGALQQAGPQTTLVASKPKPVVVTKPVEIPQPVVQPAPAPAPISGKGRGGFWYGVVFGIAGSLIGMAGWRRRRQKPVVAPAAPSEIAPIAWGASVYEQLILKAMERQGHKPVGSKAIEGLGAIWTVEKDGARHGVLCLTNGEFFERKVLEQFLEALKQEALPSGTVMALGAFTAPAQAFAKENKIALISREEVVKLMEVELKGPVLTPDAEMLKQQLAKSQSGLDQAQARIQALEQELAAQKKQWEELQWYLGEERTKKQALEQQVAELTRELAERVEATKEEANVAPEVGRIQERRKWPRLDLSTRKGKGILIRATSDDGEPMNGDARNISAGGLCMELPQVERLADEFEVKLFFPDRTKPIEAIGKILWKGKGTRRRLEQLGVAFSAVNVPDQEAISQFVEERTPHQFAGAS